MCTLSVITRGDGYLLGMNRDESIHRADAAPPAFVDLAGTRAIYPRDAAGGTWIATNHHGIALALLNWNDVPAPGGNKPRSRGEVIPALINSSALTDVSCRLPQRDTPGTPHTLNLDGLFPFRLIGVFPAEYRIAEWRWDGHRLSSHPKDWTSQHWFSSSLSDAQAEAQRGAVCHHALRDQDAGTSSWLRRLHASHENGPGPFSLCVHREGVRTLSYSEVSCSPQLVEFFYSPGSPCEIAPFTQLSTPRA